MKRVDRSGLRVTSNPRPVSIAAMAGLAAVALPVAAPADNPAFQDFLNNACIAANSALRDRCNETIDGNATVSGASQSSLNPNQALAGNADASLVSAERAAAARSPGADAGVADDDGELQLELGPFSLLLNGRMMSESLHVDVDASRNRSYDLDTKNLEAGIDYRLNDRAVIGAWIDARRSRLDFAQDSAVGSFTPDFTAGRVDTDSVGAAVFAGIDLSSALHLAAAAGYTATDYDIERRAVFEPVQMGNPNPEVTVVETSAVSEGNDRWATISMTHGFEGDTWHLDPFVGVTWSASKVRAYEEADLSGSGLAMSIGELDSEAVIGTIGFSANRVLSGESAVWVPQLRFEYGYGIEVDAQQATASFLLDDDASNRFDLRGDDPDRDYAQLGVGIVAVMPNGWSVYLDAQSFLGVDNVDRYTVAAGLRLEL